MASELRTTGEPSIPSFPTVAISTPAPSESVVRIEATASTGKYMASMRAPGS
jgi:hypothetical protein